MTHSFPTRRSSDLARQQLGADRRACPRAVGTGVRRVGRARIARAAAGARRSSGRRHSVAGFVLATAHPTAGAKQHGDVAAPERDIGTTPCRSEEHTSEIQSLMRISYAVFCLKKKK